MPALPPVPQMLRVKYDFAIVEDLTAACLIHVPYTGTAPNPATCVTLATDLYNAWATEFQSLAHGTVQQTGVDVEDLTSPTSGTGSFAFIAGGTRAGTQLPADVCALVNAKVSRRYRGGKPRTFWPLGVAEDLHDPQTWNSGFVSAVEASQNSFVTLIQGIVASGCALGAPQSVSYYKGFVAVTNPISGRTRDVPVLRTGGPVVDTITSYSVNAHPGTQRRRLLLRP